MALVGDENTIVKERKEGDCKKCGDMQPYFWDFEKDGLWICNCHSIKKRRSDQRKKKALDLALEKINERFGNTNNPTSIGSNPVHKRED